MRALTRRLNKIAKALEPEPRGVAEILKEGRIRSYTEKPKWDSSTKEGQAKIMMAGRQMRERLRRFK